MNSSKVFKLVVQLMIAALCLVGFYYSVYDLINNVVFLLAVATV